MLFTLIQSAWAISATVSPGDDLGSVMSSLGPGDVITFTGGTYELESTLRIQEAVGTAEAPITLTGPTEGSRAILKSLEGDTVMSLSDSAFVVIENLVFEGHDAWEEGGGGGFSLGNSSSVTFHGNEVRRVRNELIRISGDTSDLVIENNNLHETSAGTGIYVGCGDGSCWMSDSVIRNNLLWGTGTEDDRRSGIVLDNGCQGNLIADNVIYSASSSGIRVETTQLGDANTVEGNAVWDTGSHGIEVQGEALVRNNVVFETGGSGIRSNDPTGDLRNVRITYNTVAFAGEEGVELDDWNGKEGMVFSSNVVANITGRGFRYADEANESTARITNNVVSGLVEGVDPAVQVDWFMPGSGVGDFEDVLAWDFYPSAASTLIGAGDPSGDAWVPAIDFNGLERNGEFPTVGALEYSGRGNPGWVIQEDFKGESADRPPGTDIGPGATGGCCGKDSSEGEAWVLLPFLGFMLRRRRKV